MRIRSGYSFRYAIGHVDDVIARLKDIGWSCAPISDRVSTFGYVRWTRAAQRAGLRPVYGVELPVTDGKRTDHWSFFAMDGLKALHELIQTATSEAGALTLNEALQSNELIKITGHRMPFDRIEPRLGLFVPLAPSLPIALAKQAINMGHEFIATSDNRYVTANQKEIFRVVLGHRADVQSYDQHIQSDDEWIASVEHLASPAHIKRALDMREAYLERCQATLAHGAMLKPKTNDILRSLCEIGAQRLGIDLLSFVNGESYGDRLNRELAVIEAKQFEDYFLILADVMQFAREHMIVGPGRGCFLPDQNVILQGGLFKPIQKIKRGDVVKDAFGKYQPVQQTYKYDVDEEIVDLEFENGETLSCTKDHEILVNGKWVKAGQLQIEQEIDAQCKSFQRTDIDVATSRLARLVKRFGWPLKLAKKIVNGQTLSTREASQLPTDSKSRHKIRIKCQACGTNTTIKIRDWSRRTSDIKRLPICAECAGPQASKTKRARANNRKAQLKVQSTLEQKIKNAIAVSIAKGSKRNSRYDLLHQFPEYRKAIKIRDNYECQHPKCIGSDGDYNKIDTHHIDRGGDSRPENIITLCSACHTRHHNFWRYQPKKAKAEQKLFLMIAKRNTYAQETKSQVKKISALLRTGVRLRSRKQPKLHGQSSRRSQ